MRTKFRLNPIKKTGYKETSGIVYKISKLRRKKYKTYRDNVVEMVTMIQYSFVSRVRDQWKILVDSAFTRLK